MIPFSSLLRFNTSRLAERHEGASPSLSVNAVQRLDLLDRAIPKTRLRR
jgi:hypothetical protein